MSDASRITKTQSIMSKLRFTLKRCWQAAAMALLASASLAVADDYYKGTPQFHLLDNNNVKLNLQENNFNCQISV